MDGEQNTKTIWNYNDILINPKNITFLFHLTNNIKENINRHLNYRLKKAVC